MRKTITALAAAATFTGIMAGGASAATYEVQKGDTLWSISKNHGTTVEQLKTWNELSSDLIFPNQLLNVDESKAQETYTVVKGDTLWKISQQFGVSVNELKAWNNKQSDLIFPDEKLSVNGERAQTAPAPSQAAPAAKTNASQPAAPASQQVAGKEITVTATAYTASCEGCSGITATGLNLKANPNLKVISVDPSVIPLGSKVYVEGYGYAVAGDTGGAIKGNKIDIFIPSKQDAINYGVKTVKVTILD
ncbi:MAG TPA: LysM peptidoglycan-binding domain-containing protein [Bacillaceae bacterium]